MPPGSKPSSSHSSRPSARRSGSSHRSSHSSHRSSYHRSHRSGYGRSSGSGLFGLIFGSLFSQGSEVQNRGTAVINQQTVNPPPAPTMYECPFCRGKVTAQPSPDGRNLLTCPNCGGILAESNAIAQPQQTVQSFSQPQGNMAAPDTGYSAEQPAARRKRSSPLVKVLFLVFIICIIAAAVRIANSRMYEAAHRTDHNENAYNDVNNDYNEPVSKESKDGIYVNALGRTVPWDSENEWYYDEDTDCYFFQNNDMDPPVWQYWFEGVSSNYGGDYGWMEWDYNENRWYVQQSENSWVPLPENEYTDRLWHME